MANKLSPFSFHVLDSANRIDTGLLNRVLNFQGQVNNVSFYQHVHIFDFINGNKGYHAILFVIEEQDEIIASLMVLKIRQGPTCCPLFNERLLVTGYPVICNMVSDRKQVLSFMIQKIADFAKRQSVFIEFRPHVPDLVLDSVLKQNQYQYTDHLNLLVHLTNHQSLWKELHESKRRQVKKSQRNGLVVEPCSGEIELTDFYSIVQNLYKNRVKKPYPNYAFFLNFYKELQLKRKAVILIAKWKGQVVGGMLCPYIEGETIYEWYIAGQDRDNVKNGIYPSVLLTWSAIEYGLKHGFKTFDFMGAGNPSIPYGVRDFKKRFGGELVNAGRYIYVNKPFIYKMLGRYFKFKNFYLNKFK
ncbi:lipid II:glycine glycyltransferase FemX [Candidatus Venteria ishoeyi]|uniref:FemAB family protein n=1 Tax=Candidatus Venteria ishoeyi TaxID=1899563 RepID=A0A1H6F583_9GAMM|nr:GNAT family N-acetyltransferase [Candidatus Venteria ishoeyi]SEH05327.1 FemAB family protein [Candidatus Venteria ishoeyi]